MCYSAEILTKLISLWFLQCFVKVAFFRTRQSKHKICLQHLSNLDLFFNRKLTHKSIKNRDFWALWISSHFEPVLDQILTPFGVHFRWFWSVLGLLGSHFDRPGFSQAASQGSAWFSCGAWWPSKTPRTPSGLRFEPILVSPGPNLNRIWQK